MDNMEKDILHNSELKKNPYGLPDGYFDTLKKDLIKCSEPQKVVPISIWARLAPMLAMAATFALLVAAGTFYLRNSAATPGLTEEDWYVFSDQYSDFAIYESGSEQYADLGMDDEDIIEYLIYTGVDEHIIELSKQQ